MKMELTRDFQQVVRVDGKEVFVEVTNTMFEKGKVVLRFIKYNPNAQSKSKFVHDISIFLDMDKFLVLTQDVVSGRIPALGEAAKKKATDSGYKYATHIYQHLGGKAARNLNEEDKKKLPDGAALSRQFKITPSMNAKFPWVLSAEVGPGEETKEGLIAPKYPNGKPTEIVRVAMSSEDFKKVMLITKAHIDGFIASQYITLAADGIKVPQGTSNAS